MNIEYHMQLTKEEYATCIRMLIPGKLHVFTSDDNKLTGLQDSNGKIYYIRCVPGSDPFPIPPYANQVETYYETSSVPSEWTQLPPVIHTINLSGRENVQNFFDNLSKYQRGELKIDE